MLNNIPESELAEQCKDALAMFLKISDAWLERAQPWNRDGRKFKSRMENANRGMRQCLASLNGEIHKPHKPEKWPS